MNVIELVLDLVSLPPTLLFILKWLVGLVLIDWLLEKLTKSKLSLEKIVKGFLIGMRDTVQFREGVQPWTFNRKIKKVSAYAFCGALGYGCLVFSALSISSVLLFILKKNILTLDKTLLALVIILIFSWAARFAYIETRIAFKNAESI